MRGLLPRLSSLIYENCCNICGGLAGKSLVCKKCESSFRKREASLLKEFPEIKVLSIWFYEEKIKNGILALKSGNKKLAEYFGLQLAESSRNSLREFFASENYSILPIPSHPRRIKERGFCHIKELARFLATNISMPYSEEVIFRTKETFYMNSLVSASDRKKNIKGAFTVIASEVNKNILLVDDILTSGSTMCELARTILDSFPHVNLLGLTIASGDKY